MLVWTPACSVATIEKERRKWRRRRRMIPPWVDIIGNFLSNSRHKSQRDRDSEEQTDSFTKTTDKHIQTARVKHS